MLALLGVWFGLSLLLAPPLQQPSPRARGVRPRGAVRLGVSSPFESGSSSASASGALDLTLENVEQVLDEMRPYLIADGGNVAVADIDGGVVRLELQGACGSCPSSTMTMKMGLERGLREKIPEIVAVEQVAPDGPQLTEEGVEEVLDEIRPFLKMAGGAVSLLALDAGGVQPTARLAITGSGSTINSVRVEIAQRLKRNVCSPPPRAHVHPRRREQRCRVRHRSSQPWSASIMRRVSMAGAAHPHGERC